MKKMLYIVAIALLASLTHAEKIVIELPQVSERQKLVLEKVAFDVKLRTLDDITGVENSQASDPSFLIFTAVAKEDLGEGLLWIDAEVEFSNGRVRKFTAIRFNLFKKGIEADVRKLDDFISGFVLPGEEESKPPEDPKPIVISKFRVTNAIFK